MSWTPLRRAVVALAALTTGLAGLAPAATARAADPETVVAAATAFGLGSYSVVPITGSGDITAELGRAAAAGPTSAAPRIVHLRAGAFTVKSSIRVGDHVYVVAEPGTTVTWGGKDGQLLWFSSLTAAGVYGGVWNGAHRGSANVLAAKSATVSLHRLTVKDASHHGIAGYLKSFLTLRDVTTTSNGTNGAYLEASRLDAIGVRATLNRRNGVQLSKGSSGTIAASYLDRNGQAVTGSTTGKVGHGLGVESSRATVTGTSMTSNKVCGASLTGSAVATFAASRLDSNGRHGLGTTAGVTATVTDSTASRNRYNGVLASGSGTRVTLQRVTIKWSKSYGLSVPSRGTAIVSDTLIHASGKINISASGRGRLALLGGNTLTGAKSHGIAVSGKSRLTITGPGNVVQANRGNGLLVSGKGTTGQITAAVTVAQNRKNGILVNSKAKLATVDCVFSGNKGKRIAKKSGGKVTILR
ncbi:MAG: right-handed parallel beta-helix repeat-containing protein [Propionicimonas sp.]